MKKKLLSKKWRELKKGLNELVSSQTLSALVVERISYKSSYKDSTTAITPCFGLVIRTSKGTVVVILQMEQQWVSLLQLKAVEIDKISVMNAHTSENVDGSTLEDISSPLHDRDGEESKRMKGVDGERGDFDWIGGLMGMNHRWVYMAFFFFSS